MNRLTSALLLGGAVLLTSYINAPAAPTPSTPRVSEDELAAIDAIGPLADDVSQETERLRARLTVVPEKPVAARDPFSFGLGPRPSRRAFAAAEPDPAVPVVDPAPAIAWPMLVALLTDSGSTVAMTAVLAVGESVEMLKVGETAGGFTVREITSTSIEVVHVATSTTTRLSLR